LARTGHREALLAILATPFWSQSYDHDLKRQRCKNYNAMSRVRFENKNNFFYIL
jgi:hypothetical protein